MQDCQNTIHRHYDAILLYAKSGQVCDQDKDDLGRHSFTREQMTEQNDYEVIGSKEDSDITTRQEIVDFQHKGSDLQFPTH